MNIEIPTIVKFPWEEVDFVADFSTLGEVIDGATLGSPSCVQISGPANLSLGTAALNADAVSDGHGSTIPVEQGVLCRSTGGLTGEEYAIEFRTTLSTGAKRARRFLLKIL